MAATQYQIMYRYISERTNTTIQGVINGVYHPTEMFIVHNSEINTGNPTQRQQKEEEKQAMIAEANDVSNVKYSMFFIYDSTKKLHSKKFIDPEVGYVIREDDIDTILDLDKAYDGNIISYYPPKKDKEDKNYVRNSQTYDKAFSFINGTLVCRKSAFDKQYNNLKSDKFIKSGEDGEANYTWEVFKYNPPVYEKDEETGEEKIKSFNYAQGLSKQKDDFIKDIINSTIVKFNFEDKNGKINDIQSICTPLDKQIEYTSKECTKGNINSSKAVKHYVQNKIFMGTFIHVPLYIYEKTPIDSYDTYVVDDTTEITTKTGKTYDRKTKIVNGIPSSAVRQMVQEVSSNGKSTNNYFPQDVDNISPAAFDSTCMFKECIITDEQFETMTIPAHEEEDFNNPPYVIKDVYKRIDIDPWIAGPISNSLESALEKVKSLVSVIGFNNVKLIKLVPLDEFLKIS